MTFDMRGGWKQVKPAGSRPLDGRVRQHLASLDRQVVTGESQEPCTTLQNLVEWLDQPNATLLGGSGLHTLQVSPESRRWCLQADARTHLRLALSLSGDT